MEDPSDTLVILRKEHMVSPNGGKPTYRTAYFLPPSVSSINDLSHHKLPSSSSSVQPQSLHLKLSFVGWKSKLETWKSWVDHMITSHQSTWKKAGIFEAILSSTYRIRRDRDDLVLGVAETWCSQTQSFIFPWGEATITLEDMIVLGGFSVLGDSVLQGIEQIELRETLEKLYKARSEFHKTRSRNPNLHPWMKMFMNSGSELEHEAFLSYWLSTFVFPHKDTVSEQVFPLAVKLARGSRIALAPSVLAAIYRDLSLLKEMICALKCFESETENVLNLTIRSPFHLVQTWVWERFSGLRPQPNLLQIGEPRLARWGNVESLKIHNVRLALDSSEEVFQWRPYSNNAIINWDLPKFYTDKDLVLPDGPGSDEDFMSFARCLRVSELVGFDTVQQYLPHRVSMQFGMDQDIPSNVSHLNGTPSFAWNHYNMNISNFELYVPSRLFEADVSVRYLKWWKEAVKPRKLDRSESSERPRKGLEGKGKQKHKNSRPKEASQFVKRLKGNKEGKEAFNMGFSSNGSNEGLEKSIERPKGKGKGKGERSHVSPRIPSNCAEKQARDFTKEASHFVEHLKGQEEGKEACFMGLSSSSSKLCLENSLERPKGKVEGEKSYVPPSIGSNCAEEQARDFTKEASHLVEHLKGNKESEEACNMGFSSNSSRAGLEKSPRISSNCAEKQPRDFTDKAELSISHDEGSITNCENGPKKICLEGVLQSEAAMEESEIQNSFADERLGEEEEIESVVLQVEENISRIERMVADIKAGKFSRRDELTKRERFTNN